MLRWVCMPKLPRVDVGGVVYHVLNRANARQRIFTTKLDYEAFERVLAEAQARTSIRLLAYCIMPNHWHLVLHTRHNGDLAAFLGWATLAHMRRWHAAHGTDGSGHLYQGRYKSFPVQTDAYLLQVCRYVERNALRAKLVHRAQDWRWSSAWLRQHGPSPEQPKLDDWPVPVPRDYLRWLNTPQTASELDAIRGSVVRGRPYGDPMWVQGTAKRFNIEQTLRPRGRPHG